MTPEGKVKAVIKRCLLKHGAWFHMPSQSGYSRRGIPDYIGILNGRMFVIETKAPGKKPTQLQVDEMEKLKAQGALAFVVSGVDEASGLDKHLTAISLGYTNAKDIAPHRGIMRAVAPTSISKAHVCK